MLAVEGRKTETGLINPANAMEGSAISMPRSLRTASTAAQIQIRTICSELFEVEVGDCRFSVRNCPLADLLFISVFMACLTADDFENGTSQYAIKYAMTD